MKKNEYLKNKCPQPSAGGHRQLRSYFLTSLPFLSCLGFLFFLSFFWLLFPLAMTASFFDE